MANTFKNKLSVNVGTSETTVYTCPASTTATIIGLSLANTNVAAVSATAKVTDTSASLTAHIAKGAPIPAGGTLVLVGGDQKLILEAGDSIKITSTITSSIDVILSMLEIS